MCESISDAQIAEIREVLLEGLRVLLEICCMQIEDG